MIIKSFNELTLLEYGFLEIPEHDKPLCLVRQAGFVFFTDVNMTELNEKLTKVNSEIDYDSLLLERQAEFMRVHPPEDNTGYVFKIVTENYVYRVEPQLFVSGVQFSCEVFMSMSIARLLELTLESRLDLDRQIKTDGRLIAAGNMADHWYPKIYPFFYNAYNLNEKELTAESIQFALVAWVSVINEKYENVLHSKINPDTPDIIYGLREVTT